MSRGGIMVTGANGSLGQLVLKSLIDKQKVETHIIIACCREPHKSPAKDLTAKGIELRMADYKDPNSLNPAFFGLDVLMFISSGNLENRIAQHTNVVNCAIACGVKHILYTSFIKSPLFSGNADHMATERALEKSGIPYTVFRNSLYMEYIPTLMGDGLETGVFKYPAGNAKCNFVPKEDLADVLAKICANPARHAFKKYDMVGIKSYTFKEVAEIASKATGVPCVYKNITIEEYRNKLKADNAKMKDIQVNNLVTLAQAIAAGHLDISNKNLETLLKRKPITLEQLALE